MLGLIKEFTTKKFSSKKVSEKASVEVTVDEILVVLGTSRANLSNEEDFDWDKDPARSFVSIEDERRRLPRKKKKAKEESEEKKEGTKALPPDTQTSDPSILKMVIELFMNVLSVNVNKIHIRFEDDFYSYIEGPYSFGMTLNSFNINSTNKAINFRSPLDLNYEEVTPDNDKNLFLKHILMQDISIYWNNLYRRTFLPFCCL